MQRKWLTQANLFQMVSFLFNQNRALQQRIDGYEELFLQVLQHFKESASKEIDFESRNNTYWSSKCNFKIKILLHSAYPPYWTSWTILFLNFNLRIWFGNIEISQRVFDSQITRRSYYLDGTKLLFYPSFSAMFFF